MLLYYILQCKRIVYTENGNDAEEVIYEDMSETGGMSPEDTTYENRIMIEFPSYISVQEHSHDISTLC